jgi:hypothetical protein
MAIGTGKDKLEHLLNNSDFLIKVMQHEERLRILFKVKYFYLKIDL